MKIIPVKIRNKFASVPMLVDDWDYKILKPYKWHTDGCGYPVVTRKRAPILAHKIIIWCPKGMYTDHTNGNTLDNRKENLRICTPSQNLYNRGITKRNTSGYKGVSWSKWHKKWRADIGVNCNQVHLGLFTDKRDAASTYNEAAKKYHGEFAVLNDLSKK